MATGKVDIFLVGGGGRGGHGGWDSSGGGGGGGGYTATHKGIPIEEGVKYPIFIGASDSPSTGFGQTANGGKPGGNASSGPKVGAGGDGGSGGGSNGPGGQDGSNGSGAAGGKGQGTTTREFGQPEGRIYATGGKGYPKANEHRDGPANSGDGGSGQYQPPEAGAGGSGIVIIRNARGVAQ